MNMSTASTNYGYTCISRSGSAFGSSSGSGTGYNSGSKTDTGSVPGSIGPNIYSEVIVPTTTIKEKEKRIQQLQEQLRESNKEQFTMIVGGKAMRVEFDAKNEEICSRFSRQMQHWQNKSCHMPDNLAM
jgi:hypothetical protein